MRGAALALTVVAGPAIAADCAIVEELEGPTRPAGAICSTYLSEAGTTGTSCHWDHALRDPAALSFAESLWHALETCRPGEPVGKDQQVNHPDSYDLRAWSTPQGTYSISVKDKGGLNRTLVFFRFEPAK